MTFYDNSGVRFNPTHCKGLTLYNAQQIYEYMLSKTNEEKYQTYLDCFERLSSTKSNDDKDLLSVVKTIHRQTSLYSIREQFVFFCKTKKMKIPKLDLGLEKEKRKLILQSFRTKNKKKKMDWN